MKVSNFANPQQRLKIVRKLADIIKRYKGDCGTLHLSPLEGARMIEEYVFSESARDYVRYNQRIFHFGFNLKNNGKTILRHFQPHEIVHLSPEILGKETEAERARLEDQERLERCRKIKDDKEGAQTIQEMREHEGGQDFKCISCGLGDRLTFISVQARSADEGMTQKIQCGHCKMSFQPYL